MYKVISYISIFYICISILSCGGGGLKDIKDHPQVRGLDDITLNRKLRVIIDYNSINYFIYRGRAMGFQYDMVRNLADYLGAEPEITVVNNFSESFELLESGDFHILATNISHTPERERRFILTEPISRTEQVLVQRKSADTTYRISSVEGMKGKTFFIKGGAIYAYTLEKLNRRHCLGMVINPYFNSNTEDLIKKVSEGKIDYTVADRNIANVNAGYYDNLDISLVLSDKVDVSWAVNKENTALAQEINKWLKRFKRTKRYRLIYHKYFENKRSVKIFNSASYYLNSGKISKYDDIIKKKSAKIGWDWKLLSALIYQESMFDPEAESWVGAYGLMQIMPETAETFRIEDYKKPENNIEAGIRYIRYLEETFRKHLTDTTDMLKFVLASYNVGAGHVLDARRLAEKYGKNPDKWDNNTDYYLLNKSEPFYYKDKASRYGYCRGSEPYNFVRKILERYNNYRNIIKE